MTQEEKSLLLKDLCARLPYGVKAKVDGHFNSLQILGISKLYKSTWAWKKGTYVVSFWNDTKPIESIKPYLRSMSSMTEKEQEDYTLLSNHCISTSMGFAYIEAQILIEWLNAHYFDFRNLIEKGLALEASEEMYKTE